MALQATVRWKITVKGIVQGVGFRPFVYREAEALHLKGFVQNRSDGVLIDVEGDNEVLSRFVERVKNAPPPLAAINALSVEKMQLAGYTDFVIEASSTLDVRETLVSPDIAICENCLAELFDAEDRRFRYPFINCTNCGPRFTIIEDIPYDRSNTTMSQFPMCEQCKAEYENPHDRRFHAQPDCCPVCGPAVYLKDLDGKVLGGGAIEEAAVLLKQHYIVAIKGLGGYHLACDAMNEEVVARLRKRKFREDKPFALMAGSMEQIRAHCMVTTEEEALLNSPRRPIVLLVRRADSPIAASVAPKQRYLGFMLPYTPLQHLLFAHLKTVLVMTSGNVSDEPICYEDEDAERRLHDIADYFLIGERKIFSRCDDSVTRIFDGNEYMLRRSRGYAPEPIALPIDSRIDILAVGPYLKNSFCLVKKNRAFVSHHIGDLENLEAISSFTSEIGHYERLFDIHPRVVAHDLHPDYPSTRYAFSLEGLQRIGIQHHAAHVASCCVDSGFGDEVIGVIFDGTGYGEDGAIWGGEFFTGCLSRGFERRGHLVYQLLPGGDSAIREPWKMGVSYLYSIMGDEILKTGFFKEEPREMVVKMLKTNYNCLDTSSMGRLFDAVSALVGIRERIQYDGQAAIELEMVVDENEKGAYPFALRRDGGMLILDPRGVVEMVVHDRGHGEGIARIAARFHHGLSRAVVDVCRELRAETGIETVALSGGVFQNMYLLNTTVKMLRENGFRALTHCRVPTNDGGVSLGQAALAAYSVNGEGA
jgi:hydrogenase maturation protein HypF